jgi:hypothetical protein
MGARVAILIMPRVTDVEIHQFWTEKWMKVPFLFFRIAQVSRMKKNEK